MDEAASRQARTRCFFGLAVENATPEQVSVALGLPCDGGCVLRTEVRDSAFYPGPPMCSWNLRSHADATAPAAVHLRELLDRIAPHRNQLAGLINKGALAELNVGVLGPGPSYSLRVPQDVLQFIAGLNVYLGVYFTAERDWMDAIAHVEG